MPRPKYLTAPGMKYCPSKLHDPAKPRILPLTEFNGGYCKECYRIYHRNWTAATQNDREYQLLQEALDHYNDGACVMCKEMDKRVLNIYPRGRQGDLQQLYYLRAHEWPKISTDGKTYRVLCLNCAHRLELDK